MGHRVELDEIEAAASTISGVGENAVIYDDKNEVLVLYYVGEATIKELSAGLRGIIGAGTNRMNKYTVGKATQGLANYILEQGTQDKGVVISYDSRIMSKEFSMQTALILNANGIKTFLFENLRPVPELSFTVRQLKCTCRYNDYGKPQSTKI